MTDSGIIGLYAGYELSACAHTEETPTNILGFRDGLLHQKWFVVKYAPGERYETSAVHEWRKVEEIVE